MAMGLSERGCLFPALTGAPWRQCVGEISTLYTVATHAASLLLRTVTLNTDRYCIHGDDIGAFFSPCVAVNVRWISKRIKPELCCIVSCNNLNVISVLGRPCF